MVGGIRPSAGVVLPLLPPALLHYTINRRKLQAVRQKICAKKAEMLGGVPSLPPAYPAFTFFPAPLSPQPALAERSSPTGKGETSGYFMQGASPLASPRLNPRGTGSPCRCEKLNGGLAPALPARRASAIPGGGLPGWSPAYPAFGLLSCPLSPRPLPRWGRGRPRFFHARGFAPCIPGAEPGRHLEGGRTTRPAGGLPSLPPVNPAFSVVFAPYPPSPLPRRGRGRPRFFSCKGLRPLHPRG